MSENSYKYCDYNYTNFYPSFYQIQPSERLDMKFTKFIFLTMFSAGYNLNFESITLMINESIILRVWYSSESSNFHYLKKLILGH